MKVIIVGAGEVGYHVLGSLSREGVEIVAVDHDPAILEHLKNEFDVQTVVGNAIDANVLEEVGAADADLFLAITNYDETNLIACMMASAAGAKTKIARVKTIDFGLETSFSDHQSMGVDLIINPYEVAAEHLTYLVDHPQVTDFTRFLDNELLLIRIPMEESNPIVGMSVMEFGQNVNIPSTLVALIQRNFKPVLPRAVEVFQASDQVYFFVQKNQVKKLFSFLNLPTRPAQRVFINGGGHIGYALAGRLERKGLDVRILEISETRCNQLSHLLDNALVLHANGSEFRVLKEEGVGQGDFFISLTADDSVNITACMLARELGVKKTIALVKQPDLIPVISVQGVVDISFSPRLLTARKILKFVRGQNLDTFFTFPNSDIEVLELRIKHGMRSELGMISELKLPRGVLIGAVKRGDHIFVPRGDDRLAAGDIILLQQQHHHRPFTRALFLEGKKIPETKDSGSNGREAKS